MILRLLLGHCIARASVIPIERMGILGQDRLGETAERPRAITVAHLCWAGYLQVHIVKMTPVLETGTMVEVVKPQGLRDSVLELVTETGEHYRAATSPPPY